MSGRPIAMADPASEYQALKGEIDAAVGRVLASGSYILGEEGRAFERELAAYVGAAHAVGCSSGTDALHLALVAAGIGPGDEVIVPAFTFVATAGAVVQAGAVPVFADIDPMSFTLTRDTVERRLSPRSRALIVVHLYGRCAPLEDLAALCREKKLVLIEDCAQALGAEHRGRRAGGWGDFGCFSFYPTKCLSAPGDAGCVTAGTPERAELLRMLRHHGSREPGLHERVGWNSRLDEIHAAVLRVKLRRLDELNERRRSLAERYREELGSCGLGLPADDPTGRHVYQLFTVRSRRRDEVRARLAAAGIASTVFYPRPLHRQPAYAQFAGGLELPACEAAADEVLSLPVHPFVGEEGVARVGACVREALA